MTLPDRIMATANDTIANITLGNRFENITNQWGGSNVTWNKTPDWGRILWELVSVYPDFTGMIGWAILFSLPFVMMWLAHADMTAAAAVGIIFSLYVFFYIPYEWQSVAILCMVIAGAALIWSVWQKRG